MKSSLRLRAGLLCCSYFYLCLATVGNALLAKPAQAQQDPTSITEAQAAAKAPFGVLESLDAGQSQELIVVYDDTKIQKEAANLRRQQALSQENSQIVAFKVAQYAKKKQQILSKVGLSGIQVVKDYSHLPMSFVRFQSKAALIRFLKNSDVVRVYKNEENQPLLNQSLPLIGQPPVAAAGRIGNGTTVVVIDTGVDYRHSAFGSCTSPTQPNGCRVVYAQDFGIDDKQLDNDGHGTNVAGIVAGVAPGTQIAALDVFGPKGGFDTDIIAAINWSIQNKAVYNVVAINLSLGVRGSKNSSICSGPYTQAFANARNAGIIPVVASGNDGFADGINTPACHAGAVSVGAVYDYVGSYTRSCTDNSVVIDKVTCFSNSASILTLLAPGSSIDAAGLEKGGTSMAAPHVAGAIAVLRSLFPGDTIDKTISRLTNTGVPITDARNGIVKPRLNLLAASETVIPRPVNDNFASAIPVSGSLAAVTGTNTDATKEAGEANHAGLNGGKSVWWSWTAPKSGNVQITTEGSDFDTLLGVYTGASVASTTQIVADDDSGANRTSIVTFNAVAGTTYHIAVDGDNGESGNVALYINAVIPATDFNNDGKTDILWNRDGYLAVWLMDGINLASSVETVPSQANSTSWKPVGTGDFNNDGKTDILWRHSAGFLSLWLMDGTKLIRGSNLSPRRLSDLSWKIVGTGDFNRDGNADILWRSDAGFVSVWLMDGANLLGGVELNPNQVTDTTWKPAATGDFNQDSKVDILWQRDDGSLKVWLMDGTNLTSEVNLTPVGDTSWKAVSTGDFDRNGKTDILWRNSDGYLSVWFMDGTNLVSTTFLNPDRIPADTGWKPVGTP